MNRRTFIRSTSLLSLLLLQGNKFGFQNTTKNEIIKPKKIKKGDTVGIISPAGHMRQELLDETIENLDKLGLKSYYTDRLVQKYGYLGGSDEDRAKDVMHMFENDKVDAIICARGGYGCARMIDLLDYDVIKKNPKALVGYSDITALLYAIFAKTGLVCFHGPVGTSTFNEFSTKYFTEVLMDTKSKTVMTCSEEDAKKDDIEFQQYGIHEGKATGQLVGGNLAIAVSMVGTPYDIDYRNKLVFLEEIGEDPYRVDRMLTQMKLAGKFDGIKGIALGIFKDCTLDEEEKKKGTSLTLHEVFHDVLGDIKVPMMYGYSFGHIENKFTMPFGINATMNTYFKTITLNESAVTE